MKESYFDGGLLQLIGWKLLGILVTVFTIGICYPWAVCMIYRWETKHTVINGHRLKFNGTAIQLFGKWIVWFVLTILTVGIYGFWVNIKLKKWIVKHTESENKYTGPYRREDAQPAVQAPMRPKAIAEAPVPAKMTSKELVKADAMLSYCKRFHFKCGISDNVCKELFVAAESAVAPDTEVVMAFAAINDYKSPIENGAPCVCAFAVSKLIVAGHDKVTTIPTEQIKGFSIAAGDSMSTLTVDHQDGKLVLGIESNRANDMLDFCNRSWESCMADLEAAKSKTTASSTT